MKTIYEVLGSCTHVATVQITGEKNHNRKGHHKAARYAIMATIAFLVACGGGGGSSNSTETAASTTTALSPTAPRTLSGRILSASTGSGVANAQVTVQGISATSDANGNYTIDNLVIDERVLLTVSANGFASTTKVAFRGTTQILTVNASLLPVGVSQQIDPATGGAVSASDSEARVALPANGLVRTDGNPISGNVTVEMTPISVAVNSSWMSGDYTAMASGQVSIIESFGAVTVTLKDAQGARVNLASGQTATIRIPVSSRSATVPATAPLFYFDESTGRWVEEGVATLVGTGGNSYYEGTVTHFSTWTAGGYPQTIAVTGCLADASGVPVANGIVMSDGIDYTGTSNVRTDNSGNFSLPIRSASRATVAGQFNGSITNTVNAGPSATTINLGTPCLALPSNNSGINIKLTWGTGPIDLDSHLYAPDGTHVYYSAKGSLLNAPYVNLDVDDVTSYGPEVVTFTRLQVGTYKYYVHNYRGTFAPGMTGSPARVELNVNGSVSLYSPAAGEGANDWWHVFNLTVDADCNVTVTPAGTWSGAAPEVPTAAAATYCAWVGAIPSTVPTTNGTPGSPTQPSVKFGYQ